MSSNFLNMIAPPVDADARKALNEVPGFSPRSSDATQEDIKTALNNTQGYIMVGHGRDHVWHALIRFRAGADPGDVRGAFQEMMKVTPVTPTRDLVHGSETSKRTDSGVVVSALGFTWRGYQRMGFADRADKFSLEFQQGFASRSKDSTGRGLEKWDREQWDPNNGYHALLILAAGRQEEEQSVKLRLDGYKGQVNSALAGVADVTWLKGQILRNKTGEAIDKLAQKPTEHFGFTDGVSQPKLLTDPQRDGHVEAFAKPLTSGWVRGAAPNLVLIKEPISDSDNQMEFGSYMAFLKIEQHVDLFDIAACGLASKLGVDPVHAKALIIGRNQNGSQLVNQSADENDFADKTDATGAAWPFACHTRKMNSRQPGQEHHRIVRRGVTYTDGKLKGIYFQCFQANLQEQFEFLFKRWANFRSQPQKGCGVDPLVGLDPNHPQQWPKRPKPGTPDCPVPETTGFTISELTTIRGGEYFYFPSIPFLKKIQVRWATRNNDPKRRY